VDGRAVDFSGSEVDAARREGTRQRHIAVCGVGVQHAGCGLGVACRDAAICRRGDPRPGNGRGQSL